MCRTIGEWLVTLLEEQNYFGTILPRIPKKIQDDIKVKVRKRMSVDRSASKSRRRTNYI